MNDIVADIVLYLTYPQYFQQVPKNSTKNEENRRKLDDMLKFNDARDARSELETEKQRARKCKNSIRERNTSIHDMKSRFYDLESKSHPSM